MSPSLLRPPERPGLRASDDDRPPRAARVSVRGPGDGADGRLDAKALYAGTSAGVVDIAAKGVASANAQPTPFGGSPQQPRSTATGTGFVIDSPC